MSLTQGVPVLQCRKGLLVWQDFPAGDGRALPLWDAARGGVEQIFGATKREDGEESFLHR